MAVDVYMMDIRALPDARMCPAVLHEIGSSRRQKVLSFVRAEDRKRCLGAGLLLARILPLYGEDPEAVVYGAAGKPKAQRVHFNLSHSGGWVLCAVGEKAVGCDIEKITEEPEGVAERFFHPEETAYLRAFQGRARTELFYRLWTWKESYVKMTGEGMFLPLQDFVVLPADGQIRVRREGKVLACHMKEYSVPGYQVSVCAEEEIFPDCVKMVHYDGFDGMEG